MLSRHINRIAKYSFCICLLLLYIETINPGLESSTPWRTDSIDFIANLNLAASNNQSQHKEREIPDKEATVNDSLTKTGSSLQQSTSFQRQTKSKKMASESISTTPEPELTITSKPIALTSTVLTSDSTSALVKPAIVNSENKKKVNIKPETVSSKRAPTIDSASINGLSNLPTNQELSQQSSQKTSQQATLSDAPKLIEATSPVTVASTANNPEIALANCSRRLTRSYTSSAANEEQFLVGQFNYGSEQLSDEIFIYQDKATLYLPIQFLADNLMLPLQVNMQPLSVSGWYLTTENTVDISQHLMQFTAQNSDCNQTPTDVYFDDWDIYVDIEVVEQILGLEIHFDHARQLLAVNENILVPLSQLLERQKRHQQFNHQKNANDQQRMRQVTSEYATIGDLALHADVGVSQRKQIETQQPNVDGFIQARTDLLGHSAYAGYSWSEYGETFNAYIEKAMADTWIKYYRLGSIDSHNLALVSGASSGEGLILNAGDAFSDDIRYIVVEGELEPGWDVELYRNGGLISVQRVGDNGQYRFEQVPYYIGTNQYQLRLFGPNGETRTESFSKLLDPSLMQADSFGMNFGVMQREQDDLKQVYASANWAVSDNFSAGIALIEQQVSDNKWLFNPSLTFSMLTDNSVWQLNLTGNETGTAANIIAQGSNSLIDWQAEWAHYQDFESWENPNNQVKQLANINVNGNLDHTNMSWALNGSWQEQNFGTDSIYLGATVAGQFQHLALSNELSWQNIADTQRWANRLALSGRVSDWYLRSYADIALLPTTELTQLVSNASTSLGEQSNYQFEVRYQPMALAEVTVRNSLSYFLDTSTLRLTLENDSEGDWFAQFKWSSSALLIAPDNTWLLDRVSHLNTGSVKIIAFQDDNNNGLFDEDELPLSGLRFSGHSQADSATDERGQLLITHIQTSRPHRLVLNEQSLPDPFLLPQNSILLVNAHPGNVAEVLFPVLFTAELDGEIFHDDGVAAKGVLVTLIDDADNQYHARVEYDGVFIFEQLVPGRYQIEINKQRQATPIELKPGEYVTLATQTISR
ncbi:carboxypeptidase-like regulatory domain-containing protein [Shewanella japonica]|uniref:carboxypeptidase-like regulatory domain-containing protein n=1 Tax=Shewanella japonica TaxID=93973 RepID=UPI002494B15A|nr:carboxypeptidase-like regulatory domain-containing protein [Shewanella japonica]